MEHLGNLLESLFTYLLYSRSSLAHVFFFNFIPCFTEFYGKRESKTRCSWLVFFPYHPPLFYPNKIMYKFYFHHLLAFLLDFANSWAPRQIWKLLYAPMGIWLDLVSLLLTISNGILMHSNISCNYIFQEPRTWYGWILYTYLI